MSKQKVYAVKKGRVPGIYLTWEECEMQIKNFPGQDFKKFATIQEAQEYLREDPPLPSHLPSVQKESHFDIYTDGSYRKGRYSWAFAVYRNGVLIHSESDEGHNKWALASRNVTAELEAVIRAIQWAETQGDCSVTIHHDYTGPAEWALGKWEAKQQVTQAYVKFMKPRLEWVSFNQIPSHTGIEGNELVDKLAAEALKWQM